MSSTADRFYDFSLRVLMVVVTLVLIGCIVFLAYRWLHPQAATEQGIALVQVEVKPAPQSTAPVQVPATNPAEVLLAPGKIFRCDIAGRVSFSDRPCPTGAVQTTVNLGPR